MNIGQINQTQLAARLQTFRTMADTLQAKQASGILPPEGQARLQQLLDRIAKVEQLMAPMTPAPASGLPASDEPEGVSTLEQDVDRRSNPYANLNADMLQAVASFRRAKVQTQKARQTLLKQRALHRRLTSQTPPAPAADLEAAKAAVNRAEQAFERLEAQRTSALDAVREVSNQVRARRAKMA